MKGRLWNPEELDDLKRSYATESAASIAKRLGHATLGVYMKAGQLGLKRLNTIYTPRAHDWSNDDFALLRELYPTMPTNEVALRLGRSLATVKTIASTHGIKKTAIGFRYHARSDVFSELAPDSAYVLGFILADGNITPTRKNQVLQIASTDNDIMEKIAAVLGTNKPIHERFNRGASKPSYHLAINDYQILADLQRLGITPRKSLTATMPNVPDALFFHFLRGYFDGDGTVGYREKKRDLTMSFTSGSKPLLESLSTKIDQLLGIGERDVRRPATVPNGWRLTYYAASALMVADAMYAEAGALFLDRKRSRFEQFRSVRG